MAQCLSVAGPPPRCGHKPTAEHPICALCQQADERYWREAEEKIVRDAKNALESRGYHVTPQS